MAASTNVIPLWTPSPSNIKKSALTQFIARVNNHHHTNLQDYWQLYRWSIENVESFWTEIWDFCGIRASRGLATISARNPETILQPHHFMDDFPQWFPERQLNFTRNILFPKKPVDGSAVAVLFRAEIDELSRELTWRDLRLQVAAACKFLQSLGVKKGDRIAAYAPNCPEVLIYSLAGAALGAIFTAGSPDFGPSAIIDRFTQTEPKVLLSCNAVYYNGKVHGHLDKLKAVLEACPTIKDTLLIKYLPFNQQSESEFTDWKTALEPFCNSAFGGDDEAMERDEFHFKDFAFDHPLYILYSSGTTGKPKCIVHGAGGTLIQHLKEHTLHGDLRSGDRILQYTTIGWMMWQWSLSALAAGASILLYDGSPFRPSPARLWELIAADGVTHFGTSAKYLQHLQETAHFSSQIGSRAQDCFDISKLRVIYSTGSPLPADTFRFVYLALKEDLMLASITGGTDIISLFAGGCPILPVYAGEIQVPCLGMAIESRPTEGTGDHGDASAGDLVCVRPFPSQPVAFWGDDPIARERYRAAYFSQIPHIWHHGDFIQFSAQTGGIIMLGRSDGTLNPAGVRFGSADLYAICAQFPWIEDSLAVGVKLPQWTDERVYLFLKLKPDGSSEASLMDKDKEALKLKIRSQLSPRHVPAVIMAAPAIPHTLNGKKVEVSVKRILCGAFDLPVANLSNPESIEFYRSAAHQIHKEMKQ